MAALLVVGALYLGHGLPQSAPAQSLAPPKEGEVVPVEVAQRFMPFQIALPTYLPPSYHVIGASVFTGPTSLAPRAAERARAITLIVRGDGPAVMVTEGELKVSFPQVRRTSLQLADGRTVEAVEQNNAQGVPFIAAVWRSGNVTIELMAVIAGGMTKSNVVAIVDGMQPAA